MQPVWLLSLGFLSLYGALFVFQGGGLVTISPSEWLALLALTAVCQGGLLLGFRMRWVGSSMDRFGVMQILAVVVQLGVIAWWVPQGRPLLMVFWILTLSHVASFFGWRLAVAFSAALTVNIGLAMFFYPAYASADPYVLGLFSCAQAFAVITHDWLYGRALRREIQARTLTEMMPVGVFRTQADGQCLAVNPRWQELTGLSASEALGDGWLRGLHAEDRARFVELWRHALAHVEPFEAEYRITRPDGRVVWLLGRAVPLLDRHGRVPEYLGTTVDITDRVHAEKKAEAANRVKTDFLANMSHEIRTPISGIVGAAELMSRRRMQEEIETYIGVISSSAESLLLMIDDLLDFSRIEAGKLKLDTVDFAVRETVESVVHMLEARATAKGISLVSHVGASVPERAHGDSMRLHQILTNLISNAIKFTAEGGVRVSIHRLDSPTEDQHRLAIRVVDTGVGIEAGTIEQLFEPFAQADSSTVRRYGGSGLGLSICRRLVDLMDGEIRVESEPGKGSTFLVELPFDVAAPVSAKPPQEDLGKAPPGTGPDRRQQLILVVDDNAINRMIACDLLEDLGYASVDANDGLQALEVLGSNPVDLVLMDCQMPGLDGYEATRRIRRDQVGGQRLPIVAVTAHAVAGDRERCLAAGMDDYISKPYASDLLKQCLQRWL
ncbi:MAG: ATP-binding protein [Acidobacteriota bacterium]